MAAWRICNTPYSDAARLARARRFAFALIFVSGCAFAADPPDGAEPEGEGEPPEQAYPGQPPQPAPPHPSTQYRPPNTPSRAPAAAPRSTPNTATTPSPSGAPTLRKGEMLFNFQDADIQAVVKTVSQMTNRNFLVDPRVKGKITIISARPVSGAAVYQIFLSALKAQGFTAVEGPSGIVKIVPEGEGKQNATVSTGDSPRGGDQLTTQVVTIQHGSATQMVPLLRPLMAPSALLSVYTPGNTLIITDYADNIRRLLKIIERIDQAGSAEVVIVPLEHASALDMAQLLGRLADNVTIQVGQVQQAGQQPGGADANRISIVPDLRTNSLLVRTDNQGRLNQIRALIAKLDVPARQGGNTRVVYLKNAEATKLAEVLRGLLAGEARASAPQAQAPGAQPVAAAKTAEASLIQADEASNALIINAPDAVYNNLRGVIEKLDTRRAQVFIEALIVEVSRDRSAEFGFQWGGGAPTGSQGGVVGVQQFNSSSATSLSNVVLSGLTNGIPTLGDGLSLAFLGNKIRLPDGREVYGVGALARALEADTDVNILSTPTLLTLDNSEAKIVVAKNVPFLTGKFTTPVATGTPTTGGVNPFSTIDRKDVGLTLKIKPQISEGNGIKLLISQETSTVAAAIEGAQDLTTNKRTLDTTVIVDDGFTIVLGGLIEDSVEESAQAVPFLSRIPLLGELFKYRKRTKKKTNLMIFLRPVIVRNTQQSQGFTSDRYDYMRSEQENAKMKNVLMLPEYPQPLLPPLVQPPIVEEKPKPVEDAPAPRSAADTGNNAAIPSAAPVVPAPMSPPDLPLGPPTATTQ